MAVPTAATFAVLGLAVIASAWQQGVSSWSLSKRTTMAFAWGLALLVLIGLNTSRSQFRMRETADRLAHSEKIRGGLASILADVANAQTHTRGYVITGDERFLDSYLAARARCNAEMDGLRHFIADSPREQAQFAQLEPQVKMALQWFQQVIDASRTGMTGATRREVVGHGEDLMDNIRATFQQTRHEDRQFFEQLKQELESVAALSYLVISIGTLASLAIFLTVLFGLDRAVGERQRTQQEIHRLNADLEQRVMQRTAELEAANKELEAFSYSVSHDLRAPLRAVDGFSQAVLDDYGPQLPDEGRRYLQTIREGAQRMGALIDDLLTFSRLGRQPLNKQTVDTGKLVGSVLDELSVQRQGRQVEVRVGDLPSCEGDPALLKQVWVNLLSNALKYTRRRAPAVVEIGCTGDDRGPVYFVRDNGTGFDMQYANKLFGVFQRLHRAEEFEGTGVGLAIVQRVLHRHGGRVWAEAAEDRGATFFFTLGGGTKG